MNVFIDTNVLISAFITRGLCAEIVQNIIAKHRLLTGELVIDEFERVLTRKFTFDKDLIDLTVKYIRTFEIAPTPVDHLPFEGLNEMDALILTSAILAKADLFVTGDSDFLKLQKENHGIKILSPRELWRMLQSI
jgi:putative PIN family toxin of toxin-antitoxin system